LLSWKFAEKIHAIKLALRKLLHQLYENPPNFLERLLQKLLTSWKGSGLPGKSVGFLERLWVSWKTCGFPGKPRYFYKHDSIYFKKKWF
jgi:hypothetical protein